MQAHGGRNTLSIDKTVFVGRGIRPVSCARTEKAVGDYAKGARKAWADVVGKYMIEDARVEPVVTLSANQNWIELTLRYIVDYKVRRGTKDRLFTRILEEIDGTQDRVGIAASTLNIEKVPPLSVTVGGQAG